ncbi:mannan endo-1,6-alpha-mannosidase [Aspergillus egyptiacus]|nr:mannan endo-1,6-alpha-mannosidase [Aspergillus egyptiacus]
MMLRKLILLPLIVASLAGTVSGIDLKILDQGSIRNAARTVAYNMMSRYHGNETGQTPGKLPEWWRGGIMFMTLIQYWHWTGDTSYNDVTAQGMLWQRGRDDFFPSNESLFLGNDDQMFWGLAAMTAAELNFPEQDDQPSWLSLAQGVFNTQIPRWDLTACNGGMRWQIWPYQAGYTTKNAISNGGLFQLAARLGRYTKNETYIQWAEKIWDWSTTTPLLRIRDWTIADTTSMENKCQDHGDTQWTYNYGTYLSGAAYMYDLTNGDVKWKAAIDGLLYTIWKTFFPQKFGGQLMSEISCEKTMTCNLDEDSFKGLLSSWLTFTATMVPHTAGKIIPKIQQSAIAAARQCSGGDSGTACGRRWHQNTWDGTSSLESDMSALSVLSSAMVAFKENPQPLTPETGATSKGNPNAGIKEDALPWSHVRPITLGEHTLAWTATAAFISVWLAVIGWLVYE